MERDLSNDELVDDNIMADEHSGGGVGDGTNEPMPEARTETGVEEEEEGVDKEHEGEVGNSMNSDDERVEGEPAESAEPTTADEEEIETEDDGNDGGDDGDDEEEEEEEGGAKARKRTQDSVEANLERVDVDATDHGASEAVPAPTAASTSFPLSRVKTIMKLDPEVTLASQEAVSLVSMATRMFVAGLARDAARITAQHKKKTLQRRDLDAAVDADPAYAFLEGMIES